MRRQEENTVIRFFVLEAAKTGDEVVLSPEDSHHLSRVLRAKPGEKIQIIAGGDVFLAEITEVGTKSKARLLSVSDQVFEAQTKIWLLQGIAKGERMDLIIQKAVELGVDTIVPMDCARSVVKLKGDKASDRRERWQKIAIAAAKQCGRTHIPEILPICSPAKALELIPAAAKIIIPWEEAEKPPFKAVLQDQPAVAAVLIGPEGGFEHSEVEAAVAAGATPVTLGQRILRTETAAIVCLSIMMYEWGGLG
jgi:16S rRNA (uracil1498-N3)-methyltransferase